MPASTIVELRAAITASRLLLQARATPGARIDTALPKEAQKAELLEATFKKE
jgi:hypothetical protein